jgi:hypothetical protein
MNSSPAAIRTPAVLPPRSTQRRRQPRTRDDQRDRGQRQLERERAGVAETVPVAEPNEPGDQQLAPPVKPGGAPGIIGGKLTTTHQPGLRTTHTELISITLFGDTDASWRRFVPPRKAAVEPTDANSSDGSGRRRAGPPAPASGPPRGKNRGPELAGSGVRGRAERRLAARPPRPVILDVHLIPGPEDEPPGASGRGDDAARRRRPRHDPHADETCGSCRHDASCATPIRLPVPSGVVADGAGSAAPSAAEPA